MNDVKYNPFKFVGSYLGAIAFYFFPIFPVSLPNMEGVYLIPEGLWWVSGISRIEHFPREAIGIIIFGFVLGSLIHFWIKLLKDENR